jgi:hypothetical protein
MRNYFGPLGKEWCLYFYVLSIIFFITFFLILIGIIITAVTKPKKMDMMFIGNIVVLLFNSILAYFVNRLLNTMCMNSIPH